MTKGCGYAMLPKFLVDTAKHTYQVHETVVAARNEILEKVEVGNATAIFTGRLVNSAIGGRGHVGPLKIVSSPVSVAKLDQPVRSADFEHTEQQSRIECADSRQTDVSIPGENE